MKRIRENPVESSPSEGTFEVALRAAMQRRAAFLKNGETDCFRLLFGDKEGVPGVVAEKFGAVVILQLFEDAGCPSAAVVRNMARWYQATLNVRAVYVKTFVKQRERAAETNGSDLRSPDPLVGEPMPVEIRVRENGLPFLIRPYDGFSTGLFLDQRDNRLRVRNWSRGARVLNLFAYTCGFGASAAAGGAVLTVNVDLSPKYLKWGRANYELQRTDPAGHEFVASDVMEFLKRARKNRREFDLVIVDPPSFAHGRKRGRSFSFLDDLPSLVEAAGGVLRDGGRMLISTNHRGVSQAEFRQWVAKGFGRRAYRVELEPALPVDFAMDPDHAKSVVVMADIAGPPV